MSDPLEKPVKRRDFLSIATFVACGTAIGTACLGMLRLAVPKVYPEPSKKYKIGDPAGFPLGEIRIPEGRSVHVFHEARGYYTVSAICTHLGCVVKLGNDEFLCPCHGSRFALNGDVISGAAPKALDWYAMSIAPDGQLVVNESKTVKHGTFFVV